MEGDAQTEPDVSGAQTQSNSVVAASSKSKKLAAQHSCLLRSHSDISHEESHPELSGKEEHFSRENGASHVEEESDGSKDSKEEETDKKEVKCTTENNKVVKTKKSPNKTFNSQKIENSSQNLKEKPRKRPKKPADPKADDEKKVEPSKKRGRKKVERTPVKPEKPDTEVKTETGDGIDSKIAADCNDKSEKEKSNNQLPVVKRKRGRPKVIKPDGPDSSNKNCTTDNQAKPKRKYNRKRTLEDGDSSKSPVTVRKKNNKTDRNVLNDSSKAKPDIAKSPKKVKDCDEKGDRDNITGDQSLESGQKQKNKRGRRKKVVENVASEVKVEQNESTKQDRGVSKEKESENQEAVVADSKLSENTDDSLLKNDGSSEQTVDEPSENALPNEVPAENASSSENMDTAPSKLDEPTGNPDENSSGDSDKVVKLSETVSVPKVQKKKKKVKSGDVTDDDKTDNNTSGDDRGATQMDTLAGDDSRQFPCPRCEYRAKQKGNLRRHLALHRIFTCAHCDFTGETAESLDEHMRDNHPTRWGRKKCTRCGGFVKAYDYEEHEKGCDGTRPIYTCTDCSKEFKYEAALKIHQRTHSLKKDDEMISCSQCDYQTKHKDNLRKHISCRHNENRQQDVKCPECEKMFYTESCMRKHLKTSHSEDRPYTCLQCGKSFKVPNSFKMHMDEVHGTESFECDIDGCLKTYKTKRLLTRHKKCAHPTDPTLLHCGFDGCEQVFTKKTHLKRHENVHTGERKFTCTWPGCEKSFRHADNMKVHYRQHTGEKPIKCEVCDYECRQKTALTYHMQKRHNIIPASQSTESSARKLSVENLNGSGHTAADKIGLSEHESESNVSASELSDSKSDSKAEFDRNRSPNKNSGSEHDVYEFPDSDEENHLELPQIRQQKAPSKSPKRTTSVDLPVQPETANLPPMADIPPVENVPPNANMHPADDLPQEISDPVQTIAVAAEQELPQESPRIDMNQSLDEVSFDEETDREIPKSEVPENEIPESIIPETEIAKNETPEREIPQREIANADEAVVPITNLEEPNDVLPECPEPEQEMVDMKSEDMLESRFTDNTSLIDTQDFNEEQGGTQVETSSVDEQQLANETADKLETPLSDQCTEQFFHDATEVVEEMERSDQNKSSQNEGDKQVLESPMSELTVTEQDMQVFSLPSVANESPGQVEATELLDEASDFHPPHPGDDVVNSYPGSLDGAAVAMSPDLSHTSEHMQKLMDSFPEDYQTNHATSEERGRSGAAAEVSVIMSCPQVDKTNDFVQTEEPQAPPENHLPNSVEALSQPSPALGEVKPPEYNGPTLEDGYPSKQSVYTGESTPTTQNSPLLRNSNPVAEHSPETFSGSNPSYPAIPGYPELTPPTLSTDRHGQHSQNHEVTTAFSPSVTTPTYSTSQNYLPPPPTISYASSLAASMPTFGTSAFSDQTQQALRNSELSANSGRSQDSISSASRVSDSLYPTSSRSLVSNLPSSSTFPSVESFPGRDFFGQFFQDPGTLPLTHPPLGQDQRSLSYAQQQPSFSMLPRGNTDLLGRTAVMAASAYPSVSESLAGINPALSQQHAQQSWMAHSDRSRTWAQPSQLLVPSELGTGSPLTRNPYPTAADYAFDPNAASQLGKRAGEAASFPMAQSLTNPSQHYDMTSAYMSTRSFNPAAEQNYSRGISSTGSAQKSFEDAYRHMGDYRTLPQAAAATVPEMYGRMGMNSALGLDKYYYPRDAMYRSQHIPSSANPFLAQTSTPQVSYTERDYSRTPMYSSQHGAYGFMTDKQYLSSSKITPTVPAPADYFQTRPPAPTDPHMQDPYRRSVIYNMMSRYY